MAKSDFYRTNKCFLVMLLSGVMASVRASANAIGSDAQNFNPAPDGLDFVTVQSSETLKPGIFNVGLFANLAVNSLPYFDSSPQSRTRFNDTLLGADLNLAGGIFKDFEASVSLPQVWMQTVTSNDGTRGQFAQTGATEARLGGKYRLFGNGDGGLAALASVNLNRIENDPYAGSGAGPTVNFELAGTRKIDGVALGVNVGRRFRNSGSPIPTAIVRPLRDQWIASVAASWLVSETNVKAIGEIFASLPAQTTDSYGDRSASSLEALLGAKWTVTDAWALHAGAGGGLVQGVASPDWRIYAGLNYAFGPVFAKDARPYLRPEPQRALPLDPAGPSERFVTQSILFEFNSDEMIGDYPTALAELAGHLPGPPPFKRLIVEGHTDSIGGALYNQKLSLRRAEAIKRWLSAKHGISAQRIEAVGYGKSRPIADNGNYQGRQANRRVEFQIFR